MFGTSPKAVALPKNKKRENSFFLVQMSEFEGLICSDVILKKCQSKIKIISARTVCPWKALNYLLFTQVQLKLRELLFYGSILEHIFIFITYSFTATLFTIQYMLNIIFFSENMSVFCTHR